MSNARLLIWRYFWKQLERTNCFMFWLWAGAGEHYCVYSELLYPRSRHISIMLRKWMKMSKYKFSLNLQSWREPSTLLETNINILGLRSSLLYSPPTPMNFSKLSQQANSKLCLSFHQGRIWNWRKKTLKQCEDFYVNKKHCCIRLSVIQFCYSAEVFSFLWDWKFSESKHFTANWLALNSHWKFNYSKT